ncbi:MAG: DUF6798 domain-containing protein [Phycisphaerae bacterium]
MRPRPPRRHILAMLIFAGVAVTAGYFAMLDDQLSDSQVHVATAALKRHQPELYPTDPVFGPSGLWKLHTPALQGILELTLIPTGYSDLTLPFRLLTPVAVMIYLGGMYALLYRQCKSWSISAFVAILSCAVVNALGGSSWGMGSLASITPAGLVRIFIPLVVLSYLRYRRQWRAALVFAFIGLCGNIDLIAAINLTLVLLVVHLADGGFRPRRWLSAAGCGLAALAAASPYAGYYLVLKRDMTPPEAQPATAEAVHRALELARPDVLYPQLLVPLLYWLLLAGVLAVPTVIVLVRAERYRTRNARLWVWFIAAALTVALGLHGLSQLVGSVRGRVPPVIDFVQASSLVMLPLYVLLAQGLTNLFRLFATQRWLLRWACVALLILWLGPAENLRVPRHALAETATGMLDEDDKPRYVRRHQQRRQSDRELMAIARWARENTPASAVFITDLLEFRMRSRRAISVSRGDLHYVFYLTPHRLSDWTDRVLRQRREVHSPPTGQADPAAVRDYAADLAEDKLLEKAEQWYVIMDANVSPLEPGQLEPVASEEWGKSYRLYRLP